MCVCAETCVSVVLMCRLMTCPMTEASVFLLSQTSSLDAGHRAWCGSGLCPALSLLTLPSNGTTRCSVNTQLSPLISLCALLSVPTAPGVQSDSGIPPIETPVTLVSGSKGSQTSHGPPSYLPNVAICLDNEWQAYTLAPTSHHFMELRP